MTKAIISATVYKYIQYAFGKKTNKKITLAVIAFVIFFISNFTYAKYILNQNFDINISALPFYFNVSTENTTIEYANDEAILKLSVKNNNGTEYNNFDTIYKLSVDSEIFDIAIDNKENFSESITTNLSGEEKLNEDISLYFKTKDGSSKKLIEVLDLKVDVISPYKQQIIIPVKIITHQEWYYDYTGNAQTFVAPIEGKYKLETWGAQGGSYNTTYYGGKGGYSSGTVSLSESKKLFIYVGGKGSGTGEHTYQAGGYNGGGSATPDSDFNTRQSSGGGATHIAYTSGVLSSLENSKKEILLVAGGGGGSAANSAVMAVYAGAGGGLVGGNGGSYTETSVIYGTGYGGTQTAGGTYNCERESLRAIGSFGQGANSLYAGGGGGYYGGGVGHCSAGGGSGYIGGVSNGVTIIGTSSMPDITGMSTMIGKTGNGYAKITFLGE